MTDVEAATAHGVAIAMAFGTNHEFVADHAFTFLMADLSRDLTTFNAQRGRGAGVAIRRFRCGARPSASSAWGVSGAFARRCKSLRDARAG
ncbi:MAG: hypothetical protein U1F68_05980 [Gammaproteobacteria bacterium]